MLGPGANEAGTKQIGASGSGLGRVGFTGRVWFRVRIMVTVSKG